MGGGRLEGLLEDDPPPSLQQVRSRERHFEALAALVDLQASYGDRVLWPNVSPLAQTELATIATMANPELASALRGTRSGQGAGARMETAEMRERLWRQQAGVPEPHAIGNVVSLDLSPAEAGAAKEGKKPVSSMADPPAAVRDLPRGGKVRGVVKDLRGQQARAPG